MATLVEPCSEIDARMHGGESFSSIEDDVIDTSDLSEDQKSALWLYGWSFVAPSAQRREARAHITQLAATEAAAERGRRTAYAAALARSARLSIVRASGPAV